MKESALDIEGIVMAAVALAVFGLLFAGVLAGQCAFVQWTGDVNTKWRPVVGCMVDVKGDGHFVPYDRWRAVE